MQVGVVFEEVGQQVCDVEDVRYANLLENVSVLGVELVS